MIYRYLKSGLRRTKRHSDSDDRIADAINDVPAASE